MSRIVDTSNLLNGLKAIKIVILSKLMMISQISSFSDILKVFF